MRRCALVRRLPPRAFSVRSLTSWRRPSVFFTIVDGSLRDLVFRALPWARALLGCTLAFGSSSLACLAVNALEAPCATSCIGRHSGRRLMRVGVIGVGAGQFCARALVPRCLVLLFRPTLDPAVVAHNDVHAVGDEQSSCLACSYASGRKSCQSISHVSVSSCWRPATSMVNLRKYLGISL